MTLLTPDKIQELFKRFHQNCPSPQGELFFVNPYTFLVAVVLSAQATDKGVNRVTRTLFEDITTPEAMLALGEERLRERISSIGLFRSKARHVIALSLRLIEVYNGEIPRTRHELETLPGVGRKTANVILNGAMGEPTIAVDTHVFRTSRRLGLSEGKTPLAVEKDLEKAVPLKARYHAHHWLILHGRYTCKAQRPLCGACFAKDLCENPPL